MQIQWIEPEGKQVSDSTTCDINQEARRNTNSTATGALGSPHENNWIYQRLHKTLLGMLLSKLYSNCTSKSFGL